MLGAINKDTGNKPPFALPAKANYGMYDARRSCARAGVPEAQPPPDFMKRAITVQPLRALHYIKSNFATDTYVAAFHYLFYRFWTPENADLRDVEVLKSVLQAAPAGFSGKESLKASSSQRKPMFTAAEVDAILAGSTAQTAKDQLTAATKEALDRGAFGAPWMWVTNDEGDEEPFFGSDRFHFMYQFLGLPYKDVSLSDAPAARAGKL